MSADRPLTPVAGDARPGAARALLYGAAVVGVLDGLDALVFFGLRGASPDRIFQAVASGLLGRAAAIGGGLATALLGLALHFLIAFLIVATYHLAARRIGLLTRRPVICGLAFGVIAFFVMQYVVVPLSAASGGRGFSLPVFLNGVIGHALLVGLPAAFSARAAFREGSSPG